MLKRFEGGKMLSPAYRNAIPEALIIQVILLVLAGMVLDGGRIAQICLFAFLAQWVAAGLIMCRRPRSPTDLDVQIIRFGFLPLVPFAYAVCYLFWMVRGVL